MAERIDWSSPRLVCIAGDFTRYDEHAVQQIGRNIELLRYRRFGETLLALEVVNTPRTAVKVIDPTKPGKSGATKTVAQQIAQASKPLRRLYDDLRDSVLALGDDVQEKELKYYVAFRKLKNFACVEVHAAAGEILVFLKLDPSSTSLEDGFTRDVSKIGHFGTGDLEVRISDTETLERASPLIQHSYNAS